MERTFVEVILPLAAQGTFTYYVPDDYLSAIAVGKRVIIEFGKRKQYSGVIYSIHHQAKQYELKPILDVIDETPIVRKADIEFWEWIAHYYICSLGEVMLAAMPGSLHIQSNKKFFINQTVDTEEIDTTPAQDEILYILKQIGAGSHKDILGRYTGKSFARNFDQLVKRGIILVEEEVKPKYKPKTVAHYRLSEEYMSDAALEQLMVDLDKKAPKQAHTLLALLSLQNGNYTTLISQKALKVKMGNDTGSLKTLVKKNILLEEIVEVSRFETVNKALQEASVLSDMQQKALKEIKELFAANTPALLYGVTSSGKTELYIKLIQETLKQQKQVLYLLPEIALTAQIIERLKKVFGDQIGIYHSKYSDNERVEIWRSFMTDNPVNNFKVVVGARSALFLPFNNLGLIIVDEEHDASYKQHDPSPHYNARDAAIYLSKKQNIPILLGSATPSLESFYNCKCGKYGLVNLTERHKGVKLPAIHTIDLKKQATKNVLLSNDLRDEIEGNLKVGHQVILFRNRRGHSSFMQCISCAHVPHCHQCDVALTYHKKQDCLRCHYCGFKTKVYTECPSCHQSTMLLHGSGTEKIEEELELLYSEYIIERLDSDSARSRKNYELVIERFAAGEIDILTGTQMIAKGLDFSNVELVGVVNIDGMLQFPDFRSHETTTQLLFQVAGRAGRKSGKGNVFIQTWDANHPVFKFVIEHDYLSFIENELKQREEFLYPPFSRIIQLSVESKDISLLKEAVLLCDKFLHQHFHKWVIGPVVPNVGRIKLFYRNQFMLKLPKGLDTALVRKTLLQLKDGLLIQFKTKVRMSIDVDSL